MADSTSTSSSNALDLRAHLIKEVKSHEVAIAELNSLSSSRDNYVLDDDGEVEDFTSVYQKNANLYFRNTIQKATASEQTHLDVAKRKLEKLNAS